MELLTDNYFSEISDNCFESMVVYAKINDRVGAIVAQQSDSLNRSLDDLDLFFH